MPKQIARRAALGVLLSVQLAGVVYACVGPTGGSTPLFEESASQAGMTARSADDTGDNLSAMPAAGPGDCALSGLRPESAAMAGIRSVQPHPINPPPTGLAKAAPVLLRNGLRAHAEADIDAVAARLGAWRTAAQTPHAILHCCWRI